MPENTDPVPGWRGFHAPRYTQTPDEVFDVWLAVLSFAELKVLLYIIRHTLGWKKDWDAISLDQICNGIVRADGTRLDSGTGLSTPGATAAIKRLITYRLIVALRQKRKDGGDAPTVYGLYLAPDPTPLGHPRLNRFKPPVPTRLRPPSKGEPPPGLNPLAPQDNTLQHTAEQEESNPPTLASGLTVDEYNRRWRAEHRG